MSILILTILRLMTRRQADTRLPVQDNPADILNQTVKSIAIARGYVAPNGIDLVSVPAFAKIDIDGEERTAIKFQLENR